MDDMDSCPGYDTPVDELCSNCGKILPCGTIGMCQDCQEAFNKADEESQE